MACHCGSILKIGIKGYLIGIVLPEVTKCPKLPTTNTLIDTQEREGRHYHHGFGNAAMVAPQKNSPKKKGLPKSKKGAEPGFEPRT